MESRGVTYQVPHFPTDEDGKVDQELVDAVKSLRAAEQISFHENRKFTLQKYLKALSRIDLFRFFDYETHKETLKFKESENGELVPTDKPTEKAERNWIVGPRVKAAHGSVKWLVEKMLGLVNAQIWRGSDVFSKENGKGFSIGVNANADFNILKFGFWRSIGIGINYYQERISRERHFEIFWQTENKAAGTRALSLDVGIIPYAMRYTANPETFAREGDLTGRTVVTPANGLSRVDRGSFAIGLQTLPLNILPLGTATTAAYLASHGMPVEAGYLTTVWFSISALNFSNFASLDSRRRLLRSWVFGDPLKNICAKMVF